MKILYYDCFSGISGDMNLGAMLDLGVPEEYLRGELNKLGVSGWSLVVRTEQRKGITGTRAIVQLESEQHNHHGHHHHHGEENQHGHGQHHHQGHQRDHSHGEHHHRNLEDIRNIIHSSGLKPQVKELSLKIFQEVARAEAKIHGKDINEVHFHEVGALDSIVDIVGAAVCLEFLQVDRVIFSPLALGSGFVHCAHGKFPVPAPATTEILQGVPVTRGDAEKELTTPTGAAIAKVFAHEFTKETNFSIQKTAYGIGGRDNPVPNVLRVYLAQGTGGLLQEQSVVLEANIDDMQPELYGYVTEKLLEAGAMDAWLTPIYMKKGRPAITLSVLCRLAHQESLTRLLFLETTTLGVRSYPVAKTMLERRMGEINTPWGTVPVKEAILDGKTIKAKPEFEACSKIAQEQGIPLLEVYRALGESKTNAE